MKRFTIFALVIVMFLISVQIASAQEPSADPANNNRGPRGDVMETISEATGLSVQEIIQTLRSDDEATLESIILEAGADPATVEAEIVATILENRPNMDEENVAERVRELLTSPLPDRADREDRRENRQERGFVGQITEILGVERADIREAIQADETNTWGDVIIYLGGDPDAFAAELTASILENAPDAEEIEARVQDWLAREISEPRFEGGERGNGPFAPSNDD